MTIILYLPPVARTQVVAVRLRRATGTANHGSRLDEADHPERTPYVRDGFAVSRTN